MYTLHGMMCSYYTAKTRAYLNYKHIGHIRRTQNKVAQDRLRSIAPAYFALTTS